MDDASPTRGYRRGWMVLTILALLIIVGFVAVLCWRLQQTTGLYRIAMIHQTEAPPRDGDEVVEMLLRIAEDGFTIIGLKRSGAIDASQTGEWEVVDGHLTLRWSDSRGRSARLEFERGRSLGDWRPCAGDDGIIGMSKLLFRSDPVR
jgi:hypothetical protein